MMERRRVFWAKFGLYVDTCLSTCSTLHVSNRAVEKKATFYFKLKKQPKAVMVILYAMCSI